jgi:hypothetical protein
MLTKAALESNDDTGKDRLKDVAEFEKSFREKLKGEALKLYLGELKDPTGYTCSESRAMLRAVCRCVLGIMSE